MNASSSSATPTSQASSMAQNQKVDFDTSYKKGTVYVFPPIIKSRVKVFKKTKEKTPQDPLMPPLHEKHAMVADQAKMDSGQDKLKGEEAETRVVTMLYEQLQKAARPGDPPAFVFTNLQLQGCEKDVIIYHERHGIIIVEIKAIDDIGTAAAPKGSSTLVKAADQLKKARDAMTSELQGLLARQPTLLVAFPNLQGTDPQDVRRRVRFFQDNPEVAILCDRKRADYEAWLQQLSSRPDPLVWEAQPDQAFVTAVSRHLSVSPFSPTQTTSDLAQLHRRWLLTPDQAPVLHCDDPLLHLWGPPGAGKTVLLLHRARRWLHEGKRVIIAVGYRLHSMLLQHLGRAAVNGKKAPLSNKLRLCRDEKKFELAVNDLGRQDSNVGVVIDEEDRYVFLSKAYTAFKCKKISCLWTASVTDIPDTELSQFSALRGQRLLLPHSIRCPPSVMEVAGNLLEATTHTPAMTVFPCLPARLPTASVKATLHATHTQYCSLDPESPHFDCGDCSKWLKSSLSPLMEGLPLQNEQWRNWIIVHTGYIDLHKGMPSMVVEWLRGQGIPAVYEMERDMDKSNIDVGTVQNVSSGLGSKVKDDMAAWRGRIVLGVDKKRNPAVHLVDISNFQGLEKACVLVLHWDRDDDEPLQNIQSVCNQRMKKHRDQLFHAVTRCQAELAIWMLSPSPAVSCLPLPQEEMELWGREEPRIREEERQRCEKRQKRAEEDRQKREEERKKREEEEQRRRREQEGKSQIEKREEQRRQEEKARERRGKPRYTRMERRRLKEERQKRKEEERQRLEEEETRIREAEERLERDNDRMGRVQRKRQKHQK